jgi:hypothetical protein
MEIPSAPSGIPRNRGKGAGGYLKLMKSGRETGWRSHAARHRAMEAAAAGNIHTDRHRPVAELPNHPSRRPLFLSQSPPRARRKPRKELRDVARPTTPLECGGKRSATPLFTQGTSAARPRPVFPPRSPCIPGGRNVTTRSDDRAATPRGGGWRGNPGRRSPVGALALGYHVPALQAGFAVRSGMGKRAPGVRRQAKRDAAFHQGDKRSAAPPVPGTTVPGGTTTGSAPTRLSSCPRGARRSTFSFMLSRGQHSAVRVVVHPATSERDCSGLFGNKIWLR